MKRNALFTLATLAAAAGGWSCWSIAQDPSIPSNRTTVTRITTSAASPTSPVLATSQDVAPGQVFVAGEQAITTIRPMVTEVHTGLFPGSGTAFSVAPLGEDSSLDNEVQGLLKKYSSVENEADKGKIAIELTAVVGKQFDLRQEARLKELKALEDQLARLKEVHTKRAKQRDQIVGDRIQQMVREADGLGWGAAEHASAWTMNSSYGFGSGSSDVAPAMDRQWVRPLRATTSSGR